VVLAAPTQFEEETCDKVRGEGRKAETPDDLHSPRFRRRNRPPLPAVVSSCYLNSSSQCSQARPHDQLLFSEALLVRYYHITSSLISSLPTCLSVASTEPLTRASVTSPAPDGLLQAHKITGSATTALHRATRPDSSRVSPSLSPGHRSLGPGQR
jgi:hypothetical protein